MAKINLDGAMKKIMEEANRQIQTKIEDVVTLQYCPEHGTFASIENSEQVKLSSENTEHHFRIQSCCEQLHAQVRQALKEAGLQ